MNELSATPSELMHSHTSQIITSTRVMGPQLVSSSRAHLDINDAQIEYERLDSEEMEVTSEIMDHIVQG